MKARTRDRFSRKTLERLPRDSGAGPPNVAARQNALWVSLAVAAAARSPEHAINHALAALGPVYGADRAWVGRYNAALTHFWAANEWVGDGIVSHFHQVQGVSVDMMQDAHRNFLRGEIVEIADVDRLPRQSRGLQAELRREGIKSTLCAPLIHEEKLIGFFGFDHVREPADWASEERDLLGPLGEYLAALLHRTMAGEAPPSLPAAPNGAVYISESGGKRALAISDIVFVESEGDYSRIHLADGSLHLQLRSLRTWVAQLPRERFLRVHRRYLVNAARIERLERGVRWWLRLRSTPKLIPVGRAFRHEVRLRMSF